MIGRNKSLNVLVFVLGTLLLAQPVHQAFAGRARDTDAYPWPSSDRRKYDVMELTAAAAGHTRRL